MAFHDVIPSDLIPELFSIRNQVCLITGAGGLGEVTAKGFAHNGAKIALCSRTKDKADRICEEIKADGGDAKSYQNTSEDVKEDVNKAAADWVLLFQMASIQEDDYELMFGDLGNLYFYIRKQDLKERNFDKVWLVLQCG